MAEAVALIDSVEPDLVFLDILLTDGEGFDVLEQVTYHGFEVIFTTSVENQAIRAFDVHAIHYLVKPIRQKDLEKALARFTALSVRSCKMARWSMSRRWGWGVPARVIR